MSDGSILLELDGSAQARYAAEIAWSMGRATSVSVDAQHVVDSLSAWDFLAFDIAGFIGSGPYFEAHELMRESLAKVGRNLIDVYTQLAQKNGITGEAYLDEGSTIREICFRSKDYEIVVMGHQPSGMESPEGDKRKLPRRSVTETLTHYVPRPLLLVQDRCPLWTKARILLGKQDVSPEVLSSCVQYITSLSVEPFLRFLFPADKSSKSERTSPNGLKAAADISKSIPELSEKNIDARSATDINEYLRQDAEQEGDVLLVVPVVEMNGKRVTSFGLTPEEIVRYLNHPAVLFWMESSEPEKASAPNKSVSTAV